MRFGGNVSGNLVGARLYQASAEWVDLPLLGGGALPTSVLAAPALVNLAALAAALAGKVAVDEDTVIMVTGGNTDAASFAATITDR